MNRRSILAALGLSPMAALPVVAAIASETQEERLQRLTDELRNAMEEVSRLPCRANISREHGFVLVAANPAPAIRVFADDGPLRSDDVTGTDDFARWEAKRKATS